jgi:hypothetical protein
MRPEVKALYLHGMELYNAGRYAEAAVELRAGQAIEPRPEFLYALGQCERNLRNCARAVEYYRAFLATNPPADQRQLAVVQVERCDQEMAARVPAPASPPASVPAATQATVAAPPPPPPPPTPGRRWVRDPVGGTLAGLGLAGLVTGAVLVGHSGAVLATADQSYDRYLEARSVRGEQIGGIVVLCSGAALLVSGILRYALHRR